MQTLEATIRVVLLYLIVITFYSYSNGTFDFNWMMAEKLTKPEMVFNFVLVYTALQVAKLKVMSR